jgi:hypothetical protein
MRRLIWTGLLAPILMFLAFKIDYSPIDWVAVPFWFPGVMIVTRLIPNDPHRMFYAIAFNFLIVWAVLFTVTVLVGMYLGRTREHA